LSAPAELCGCPDCGALQRLPEAPRAGVIRCVECRSVLERTHGRSQAGALACALAALLLLVPANLAPFLTTSVLGVSRQSVLASSALAMQKDGWPLLAIFIFAFVVVAPFLRFGLLSAVLGLLQLGHRPAWLGRAFRYADLLQTWAMPDVFLLGLAVAYARLRASIAVTVEMGALAFIAVGVLALFTRATLDKGAVWRSLRPQAPLPGADAPGGGATLTCTSCDWLAPADHAGQACPRCAARLHARKPEAAGRATALSLAALLFYLPANLLPLATLPIGLTPTKYTVLQGVVDLAQAHLFGLALLVFCASFAIPFLKLAGLGWSLLSVLRGSDRRLRTKTRLYHVVEEIGRWSMVDPYVIACFVPVMQYNALIYGRAEPAATPFALVVVMTMTATRCFDPRLMWDAAARRGSGRGRPEPFAPVLAGGAA
jgi:paraquat-inducible protein A